MRLKKLGISLTVLSILTLSGCVDDQYTLEKRYWKIHKLSQKIFGNPHATPPNQVDMVVEKINSFITRYPDSKLSLRSQFTIAFIYLAKEEYDRAREHLRNIIEQYKKTESLCAEAAFLLGKSYEQQDKWDLALKEYKNIMEKYPKTIRSFALPVYIARYYQVKHMPEKMISAYREAVGYYSTFTQKYPDSPLAFTARKQIIDCYAAIKDWNNAIKSLDNVIELYKGRIALDWALFQKALIYRNELKNEGKAKENLTQLQNDYPKSRLTQIASALLKEMEKKQ